MSKLLEFDLKESKYNGKNKIVVPVEKILYYEVYGKSDETHDNRSLLINQKDCVVSVHLDRCPDAIEKIDKALSGEENKKVVYEGWLSKEESLENSVIWIEENEEIPKILEISGCIFQELTEDLIDYYDEEFRKVRFTIEEI